MYFYLLRRLFFFELAEQVVRQATLNREMFGDKRSPSALTQTNQTSLELV